MHGAGGMSAGVCAGLCSVFHVCMSLCSVALGMFPIHVHAYIAHVPRGYVCVCVSFWTHWSGTQTCQVYHWLKDTFPPARWCRLRLRGRCPNSTDRVSPEQACQGGCSAFPSCPCPHPFLHCTATPRLHAAPGFFFFFWLCQVLLAAWGIFVATCAIFLLLP